MYRVVFCPDEGRMEEAETMAKDSSLPILVGRNGRLEGVEFDDSTVSVIEVPVERKLVYAENLPRPGFSERIECHDDFIDMSGGAKLVVVRPDGRSVDDFPPTVLEKHLAVFAFRAMVAGEHSFFVVVNGERVAEGRFTVDG